MARILSIVAAVLSLAALVVAFTRGPSEPEQDVRTERDDRDDERLAAMEQTLANLVRRMESLERMPVARPTAPTGVAPAATAPAPEEVAQQTKALEALRSDVDALLTGEALGTDEGRKRFKELVREAQDEVFAERAKERAATREQARAERLKKFFEAARLSSTQQQDVTKLLEDEANKRKALQGQPRNQTREQMTQIRKETNEAAQRVLDAEQLKQFEEMRREERRDTVRDTGRSGAGRIRTSPGAEGGERR